MAGNKEGGFLRQKKRRTQDRNRLSDVVDKYLFFVLFVSGSFGIILLKLSGLPSFAATLLPVSLMLIYVLVVLIERRMLLREDRAADNVYYLGFLYTLTSLGIALYLYSKSDDPTAEIISSFGIALTTTIIGLASRLLLQQWRTDPVEVEQEARMDLVDSVYHLKGEMSESISVFQSFRTEARQVLDESFRESVDGLTKGLKQSLDAFVLSTEGIAQHIDESFQKYTDHAKKMNSTSSRTAKAAEKLLERIENIEAPEDLLASKINPLFSQLEDVTKLYVEQSGLSAKNTSMVTQTLSEFVSVTEQLKTNASELSKAMQEIRETETNLDDLQKSIIKFSEAVKGHKDVANEYWVDVTSSAGRNNDALKEVFDVQGRMVKESENTMNEYVGTIKRIRERVENELNTSIGATKNVQDALISLANTVSKSVTDG